MSLEKSLARHLDLEYDCQLVFPHTGFADAEKKSHWLFWKPEFIDPHWLDLALS